MSFSNIIAKGLETFDGAIARFRSKKWHYAITIPGLLILLYALYFIFCFKDGTYSDFIAGYQRFGLRSEVCFFAMQWIWVILIFLAILYLILEASLRMITGKKIAATFLFISSLALIAFGYTTTAQSGGNYGYGWHHDSGVLGTGNHWSIIFEIFESGKIPASVRYNQYYQPKAYHAIMAAFMHFNDLFVSLSEESLGSIELSGVTYDFSLNDYQLMEMNRILMAYVGILALLGIFLVYEKLLKKGAILAIACSLNLMIPQMWYIHFFLNNDGFAFCLTAFALYFALLYRERRSYFNIIMTAIFIGLSMMVKINSALVALPIALIFLLSLIDIWKKNPKKSKERKGFLIQIAVFAVIVFPLGLWVPIHNYAAYDIPFGYVMELDRNGFLYIDPEFYNPFQRYIAFPSIDLFFSPFNHRSRSYSNGAYQNVWGEIDFNCWSAFIKTLCFEEQGGLDWTLKGDFAPLQWLWTGFALTYYYVLIILFLLGLAGSIGLLIRRLVICLKMPKGERLSPWRNDSFLLLLTITMALTFGIGYVFFCYRYPFGCTQNSRYAMLFLVPAFIAVAYSLTSWLRIWRHNFQKSHNGDEGTK